MKIGTAIIIFFVAIIALVAEFILYMIFGIGAILSGGINSLTGTAFFFVTLMVMTIATGVLAPICAIIQIIVDKVMDVKKIKSQKQNKITELFLKDIGTSLLLIFLALILILMIVFGSVGMEEVNKNVQKEGILDTSSISQKPNTVKSKETADTSSIVPKTQNVSETKLKIYTEQDVKDVVAEAKGMADNLEQKKAFWAKYTITQGQSYLVMFTPYANTVGIITGSIEKYDEYTLDTVRQLINLDNVYTTAFNIQTSEYISSWDTSNVRAVIEYGNGYICRGKIDKVDSETGEMDANYNYNYKTSISATFDCYSDIHKQTIKFIYIAGNFKVTFNADMTKYK